mmetsp:Transcript_26140/g.64773  ORF Transcript_26140/g.64773 Transcript_26140/m.64773 type:complete len:91 (+) Transcript_26140:1184-1456(+)
MLEKLCSSRVAGTMQSFRMLLRSAIWRSTRGMTFMARRFLSSAHLHWVTYFRAKVADIVQRQKTVHELGMSSLLSFSEVRKLMMPWHRLT